MTNEPLNKVIFLVTGNVHKFEEARLVLNEFDLSVAMLNVDTVEIQADSVETVAKVSVKDAAEKCSLPVIVEDAGLFIKALKGFPGPYSSYVFRTIGVDGIIKLMENERERAALFHSSVAFASPNRETTKVFHGTIKGAIVLESKGSGGFGFDPIFSCDGGSSETFADMSMDRKNLFSHRAKALRRFAEWYLAEF